MPLKTQVIDAENGRPIPDATVLRIICDVHDFSCQQAKLNWGQTDQEGRIKMAGECKWMIVAAAPGGIPVPNHQIAFWKEGYQAFVFSQYGNIAQIKTSTKRTDLIEAIEMIPIERKEYDTSANPDKLFLNGKIMLSPLPKKPQAFGEPPN
jgi:hypothetical protein